MPRTIAQTGLLLALVALLAACAAAPAAPPPAVAAPPSIAVDSALVEAGSGLPQVGEPAPDFRYTLADGSARQLSELRGRPVLINFWATWCGPCEEEMPDLQRLSQSEPELVVLGVNRRELVDVIVPFAEERGLTFTLIANPAGDIADRYGAKNIPISFFLHRDGTIAHQQLGIMDYETMRARVAELR